MTLSDDGDRDKSKDQQKKKTRRTRKDQQGRDFTCPCGKSYLSYPALYTHVKTKHQGKTPKEDGQGIIARVEVQQQGDQRDPLDSIKESIEKYFPSDLKENYPAKISEKEIEEAEKLISDWKQQQVKIANDPANCIPNTSIDCIFGHFLSEVEEKVRKQAYHYLIEFVLSFRKGIVAQKKQDNYCAQNNGSNLPYIFNDLILHNRISTSMPSRKSSLINHTTLACKMLYYFGSWLFNQRYTNFSVKFNSANQ